MSSLPFKKFQTSTEVFLH